MAKGKLERLKEKKLADDLFIQNESVYEQECFDKSSVYFSKMICILENSKSRGLVKERGYELHHKIPRSFFKKKKMIVVDNNNLYKLTYSEHFMVHYYAYLCATKFMKSSMCLAFIQMKRVCNKNTNEYDTKNLSKIFNSIKLELYDVRGKSAKDKTFNYFKDLIEENFNGEYELLSSNRIHDVSNDRVEFRLRCRSCGRELFIKSGSSFIKSKHQCECHKVGFKENVSVLWFGINRNTNKAEWEISHVSYAPSMKSNGTYITKNYVNQHPLKTERWWIKQSVIDIQSEGYDWKLDENRRLLRTIDYSERMTDVEKDLIKSLWFERDISNNFFYRVFHKTAKTYAKYLNLPKRDYDDFKKNLYRVDFSDEKLTSDEWEKKLNLCWITITKKHIVTEELKLDKALLQSYELFKLDPDILSIANEVIKFMVENNVDESLLDELFIDAYLTIKGCSDDEIDDFINKNLR